MSTDVDNAFPPLPKRIETKRLVLRPFEFGDVDDPLEDRRPDRVEVVMLPAMPTAIIAAGTD